MPMAVTDLKLVAVLNVGEVFLHLAVTESVELERFGGHQPLKNGASSSSDRHILNRFKRDQGLSWT